MSHFGIGIYHTKTEHNVGSLMRSAYCFGASFVFTIGRRYRTQASDTTCTVRNIPYYDYQTIDDLLAHMPFGSRLIGVELDDRARPLDEFCHPAHAVYLLGAEDHGIPPSVLDLCHDIVQIPDLKHCLNVSNTGTTVLYDRKAKGRGWRP